MDIYIYLFVICVWFSGMCVMLWRRVGTYEQDIRHMDRRIGNDIVDLKTRIIQLDYVLSRNQECIQQLELKEQERDITAWANAPVPPTRTLRKIKVAK